MEGGVRYGAEEKFFHCPSATTYGYTFNSDLVGQNFKHLKDTKETPLVYDGKSLSRNASAPSWSGLADPPRHGVSHPTINTVGFADGHVKYYPPAPPSE
jgi:hypothetical protein